MEGQTILVVSAATLALLCLAQGSSIPWWNIKVALQQGPNVCVVEEVPKTKHKVWTECKYWNPREICGQKPILRYECCEGYKRVPDTVGCIGVKPLKNVLQTARDLGARKFVKYIEESGLATEFTKDGSLTLFAPSDEAMQELKPDKKRLLERYQSDRRNPIVMYHTLDRRITSPNFKADLLIDTKYSGHKIRLNKFSSKVETINCANIVRKDHEATNGIVHIIDDVLDPTISSPRNLIDILIQDGRFTQMARMMEQSGIASSLRRSDSPITILAPSDEAFQKLPKSILSRITKDNYARGVVMKNHILPHTLCLPAVLGKHKLRTESEEKITVDCEQREVTVEGKKLAQKLTMARNGVLYMMDDVLIPNRAKSILQLTEEAKLDSFLQLLKTANLEDTLDDFGEYTVFAPTDQAMSSLGPERLEELHKTKEEAKQFILHHIIQERVYTYNMANNEVLMSLDGELPLRMQVNRKSYGVDGSMIQTSDIEGLNGVLHMISKPLIPATKTWRDILQNNSTFSSFLEAMDQVTADDPEALNIEGYKTLFVPTNSAFQELEEQQLSKMTEDVTYLSRVIKSHIAERMITSESLVPGLQYYMETEENEIEILKEENTIKVNGAEALECDLMTKNGVLHVIDKVLLPEDNFKVISIIKK